MREGWKCTREWQLLKSISGRYRICTWDEGEGSPNGESSNFRLDVELHQGSTLSPFIMVMDVLMAKVRKDIPESMMFVDDVVLCAGNDVDMTGYLVTEEGSVLMAMTEVRKLSGWDVTMWNRTSRKCRSKNSEELKNVNNFKYLGSVVEGRYGYGDL